MLTHEAILNKYDLRIDHGNMVDLYEYCLRMSVFYVEENNCLCGKQDCSECEAHWFHHNILSLLKKTKPVIQHRMLKKLAK